MSDSAHQELLEERGFWVADWLIEPRANQATRGEEEVRIEPKVMHVLICMAERPKKTVTKEEFMERVWAGTIVTDDVLSRCISELRKVFNDDARSPAYIETIRKSGYRLIAPVRLDEPEPPPRRVMEPPREQHETLPAVVIESPANQSARVPAHRWGRSQRALWVGVGLAVLVGIVALVALLQPSSSEPLRIIPLTSSPGEELHPAVAPDGEVVAFSWAPSQGTYRHIYMKQTSAETPLQVTDQEAYDSFPTWSADQQSIAFVRSTPQRNVQVIVAPVIGRGERVVADLGPREVQGLSWSPNPSEQQLVLGMQASPYASFGISLLSLERDTLIQLTKPPAYSVGDIYPVFSPNGQRIAFVRSITSDIQDVYVMPASGGRPTQITTDSTRVTGLDWMPDGNNLVVTSDRGGMPGLWRVPLTGNGGPERISSALEGNTLMHPSVARVGRRIAFVQHSSEVNIGVLSANQRQAEPLITSTRWDSHPSLSPDGSRIAFVTKRSGYPEIWVADQDGENLIQVTNLQYRSTGLPRWSPDGKMLSFVARSGGDADIYVATVEGASVRPFVTDGHEDVMPSWSQDGRFIYFASNRTGSWQIWRKSLEGGELEQMTFDGGYAAQEGPDGTNLYFMRPDTNGIWVRPLPPELPVAAAFMRTVALDTTQMPDTTLYNGPFPLDSTLVPIRQVIEGVNIYDAGNWIVTAHGIFFPHRLPERTLLGYYRFRDGYIADLRTLPDLPRHPSLSVSYSGDRVLVTQVDRQESDILLIEGYP